MKANASEKKPTQLDKFKEAARVLQTDDREEVFDELVKRIARTPMPATEDATKRRKK